MTMGTRYPFETPPPKSERAFRREVWLQVYLPLILGTLILGGLVALGLVMPLAGGASTLADASLILLVAQIMALGLVPLVLFAMLAYGVAWLIRRSPPYLRHAAAIALRISDQAHTVARYVSSPSLAAREMGPKLWRVLARSASGIGRRV